MDASRQLLRWAIPGVLLELLLAVCIAVHFVITGHTLTLGQVAAGSYSSLLVLATALTGLGVPVGFLVYQIHFWIYWRVPLPLVKTPEDRGYTILRGCCYNLRRLFGRDLDRTAHLEKGRWVGVGRLGFWVKTRPILRRYQHNWGLVDSVWTWVLAHHPDPEAQARAQFLGDTYLCLGTTMTSAAIAGVVYFLYEVLMHADTLLSPRTWAAFLVNALLLSALAAVLRANRCDTLWALEMLKQDLIIAYSRKDCRKKARKAFEEAWGHDELAALQAAPAMPDVGAIVIATHLVER